MLKLIVGTFLLVTTKGVIKDQNFTTLYYKSQQTVFIL